MKSKRKFVIAVSILLLLVPVLVAVVTLALQVRQDNLDHALVQAVKTFDVPKVNELLQEGASANAADTDEPPPTLQTLWKRLLALLQGKPAPRKAGAKSILYWLLLDERDINLSPDVWSRTDAISAALITHGADIHDTDGMSYLITAALLHFPKSVHALIAKRTDLEERGSDSRTALMWARGDVLRELVKAGADINATDKDGYSVLMLDLSDRADVEFLLQHGADVNQTDVVGLSILHSLYVLRYTGGVSVKDFGAIKNLLDQHGARLSAKDIADLHSRGISTDSQIHPTGNSR